MFTHAHDFLIEDRHEEQISLAVSEGKFSPVWAQAKRILEIMISIPLPAKWKAVILALFSVADMVALKEQVTAQISPVLPPTGENKAATQNTAVTNLPPVVLMPPKKKGGRPKKTDAATIKVAAKSAPKKSIK